MAHYAELNHNNEVISVVYMDNQIIKDEAGNENDQLGIDHLHYHHGTNRRWIRTSYSGEFRGKYAGIGDLYIEDLDIFVSSQPHPSLILDESTGSWKPPFSPPDDTYSWDEELKTWSLN